MISISSFWSMLEHRIRHTSALPHHQIPMMQVRKAVVTAAAAQQRTIPLQRLVDRNGCDKTALELIIEEITSAGIDEICVVVYPGDVASYQRAAGDHVSSLRFIEQDNARGYADAIHRAAPFIGDDPFLHLVGDHLYLSRSDAPCAQQLVKVASENECSVSAVQATRENKLPYFGIVAGTHVPRHSDLYEIHRVVEKPTPTLAEQELVTAGLRAGQYLGFFGMHVLTADVLEAIEQVLASHAEVRPTLSDAAALLPTRQKYLAYRIQGLRYNIGVPYGLLVAQLAIGLSGKDRDLILTELVDLLANRPEATAS